MGKYKPSSGDGPTCHLTLCIFYMIINLDPVSLLFTEPVEVMPREVSIMLYEQTYTLNRHAILGVS